MKNLVSLGLITLLIGGYGCKTKTGDSETSANKAKQGNFCISKSVNQQKEDTDFENQQQVNMLNIAENAKMAEIFLCLHDKKALTGEDQNFAILKASKDFENESNFLEQTIEDAKNILKNNNQKEARDLAQRGIEASENRLELAKATFQYHIALFKGERPIDPQTKYQPPKIPIEISKRVENEAQNCLTESILQSFQNINKAYNNTPQAGQIEIAKIQAVDTKMSYIYVCITTDKKISDEEKNFVNKYSDSYFDRESSTINNKLAEAKSRLSSTTNKTMQQNIQDEIMDIKKEFNYLEEKRTILSNAAQ